MGAEAVVREYVGGVLDRDLNARMHVCPEKRLSHQVFSDYLVEVNRWIPLQETTLQHVDAQSNESTSIVEVVLAVGGEPASPFFVELQRGADDQWLVCGQSYSQSGEVLEALDGSGYEEFQRLDGAPVSATAVDWRSHGWTPHSGEDLNWTMPGTAFDGQEIVMRLTTTFGATEADRRQARRDFLSIPAVVDGAVEALEVPAGCIGVRWAGLAAGMVQPPDVGRFEEYVLCDWDTNTLMVQVVALGTGDLDVAAEVTRAIQGS